MRFDRRRLVVLLAALLLAGLTARLGFWQLDRAGQKLALQAAREAADRLPALLSLDAGVSDNRRARLQGQWRTEWQLWLGNRPHDRQDGFVLVTPLQLADGSLIWVQRGWQARQLAGYQAPPWPPTPQGLVSVEGRLARQASRAFELGAATADGVVRQNLDLATPPAPGMQVQPWVLWQLDGCAPLRCDWPAPDLGVSKHHGYAVQWFALSALTLVLYVWFQLIAPRRRRHAA